MCYCPQVQKLKQDLEEQKATAERLESEKVADAQDHKKQLMEVKKEGAKKMVALRLELMHEMGRDSVDPGAMQAVQDRVVELEDELEALKQELAQTQRELRIKMSIIRTLE